MKPASITVSVDIANLPSFTDDYLASLWHVSQINPAPFGDEAACELADAIRTEMIRRWLAAVPAPLHSHSWDHVEKARRAGQQRR